MKISLSTIHASDNYGSVLQAWALTQLLSEHGHVTVVDHRPAVLNAGYAADRLPYQPLRRRRNPRWREYAAKHRCVRTEMHELLPLGPRVHRVSTATYAGADVVVVGSDEIWSSLWGAQTQFYAAKVPDGVRTIAYGASVGRSSELPDALDLSAFDAVLARDRNTANACADRGRLVDALVVDPVLAVDPSSLRGIASPSPASRYVLLYLESGAVDTRVEQLLRELDHGVAVVSVGFDHPGATPLVAAGVREFVGLVAGAERVVTDMFHGIVTSVALGVPVTVLDKASKRAKQHDLLDRLGAAAPEMGSMVALGGSIDVEDLRRDSRAALRDALGDVAHPAAHERVFDVSSSALPSPV